MPECSEMIRSSNLLGPKQEPLRQVVVKHSRNLKNLVQNLSGTSGFIVLNLSAPEISFFDILAGLKGAQVLPCGHLEIFAETLQ